jgi:hypothetical protein
VHVWFFVEAVKTPTSLGMLGVGGRHTNDFEPALSERSSAAYLCVQAEREEANMHACPSQLGETWIEDIR